MFVVKFEDLDLQNLFALQIEWQISQDGFKINIAVHLFSASSIYRK